jgi:hypothetical protein
MPSGRPRPNTFVMRVQRDGAWLGAALLAGVAAAVPLWSSRFLPFQDAPQHLAAVTVLAGDGGAAITSRGFFEVDFWNAQYSAVYLAAAGLARIVGPDAGIRLLLSMIALLLPVAAWMLLGSFDRDRRLAVFAPALFQTAPLFIGIYNFVAVVPVTILAVALVERQLRAPAVTRGIALAALCVLLLHLHPSGLVIAAAAAGALALTRRPRRLRLLLPLVPAMALLATAAVRAPKGGATFQGPAVWQSPLAQVRDVLRFGNVFPGRVDEAVIFLLVAAFLAIAWQRAPRARPAGAYRVALLASGLLGAYLLAPHSVGYVAFIHLRAIPFLLLFCLASPLVARTPRTSALLAIAVGVQLLYAPYVVQRYRQFDREVDGNELEEVLGGAVPGQRLVSLMLDRKSKAVHFEPYLHFGLYYQVLRGGRTRFNFGELPWMPLHFRRDVLPATPYPVRWEFDVGYFDWRRALPDADYIFVRTPDPDPDAERYDAPEPGPEFADGWHLKERAGRWELFVPAPRASPRMGARSPDG